MEPILTGLGNLLFLPSAPFALAAGCLFGLFVGLMPGVNSRSGLLIAIPFALTFDPVVAAIFLVALHASSAVSGTIPAVIFGAPTSASEAATAVDGYPLALKGDGARTIGTIVSASAIGGVAGAAVLLLAAPLAASIILTVGSPEIAALAAAGILAIAAVSSTGLAAGIAAGAAGILCSTIGLDALTAVPRFTFGVDYLLDGLSSPALIAGLIAIPELMRIESDRAQLKIAPTYRQVLAGALEPFRHIGLTIRSSIVGLVVGITPGIGAGVAVWLSYAQATKTTKPAVPFGDGAIEGVIAPEAAGGSKEGGSLIPTLFLGVPGSSGMAIILAAFAIVGVRIGPQMLTSSPEFPATIAWTVAVADVLGMLVCIALAPWLVRLAALSRRVVAVCALCAASLAAFIPLPVASTAIQILVFAVVGIAFARAGLSRPAFLIGFVIGPVFEKALLRSSEIYGWSALARPGVIAIAIAIAAAAFYFASGSRKEAASARPGHTALLPLLLLIAIFVTGAALAPTYKGTAGFVPSVAAWIGLAAALVACVLAWRAGSRQISYSLDGRLALLFTIGMVGAVFVGPAALALPLAGLLLPPAPRPTVKAEPQAASDL